MESHCEAAAYYSADLCCAEWALKSSSGHTLGVVLPEMEALIGANLSRIVADRGYRGHNAPPEHRFRVYASGQKRRVTEAIKRDLRRRSAVEPCIGHLKSEHRMGRNHLAHPLGDAANAVLAAAGYNSADCWPGWRSYCVPGRPPSSPPQNRPSIRALSRNRRSSRTTNKRRLRFRYGILRDLKLIKRRRYRKARVRR